jgi:hypothetical protein
MKTKKVMCYENEGVARDRHRYSKDDIDNRNRVIRSDSLEETEDRAQVGRASTTRDIAAAVWRKIRVREMPVSLSGGKANKKVLANDLMGPLAGESGRVIPSEQKWRPWASRQL